MSKVLKNLSLTFGESASSPKVLTIASVNNLIKAIVDPDVTTNFSGHVTSESGSIDAAQAYSLAMAGISFHGNIIPIDFNFSVNKTSIVDGDEIDLITSGVPVNVIDFNIESVNINSGVITEEEVRNICQFEGSKLLVVSAGIKSDWSASVVIKAKTKYIPSSENTVTINIVHKAYSSISLSESSVNFDAVSSKTVTLSFGPAGANVPIESIRASLENVSAIYEVGVSGNNILIDCKSVDDLVLNKINIEATDIVGKVLTSSINISNKVLPTITIEGPESFNAKNGTGETNYTFNISKCNVPLSLVKVTSSNSDIKVSNASINGFKLSVSGTEEDISSTIIATIKVDLTDRNIMKSVTAKYTQVFNEFKVYKDSAWIVPNSNLPVKVGDVDAVYIGEGLWMVDDNLVDETMKVTAGGSVVGKYGSLVVSDGSELQEIIVNEIMDNYIPYSTGTTSGLTINEYYKKDSNFIFEKIFIKNYSNTYNDKIDIHPYGTYDERISVYVNKNSQASFNISKIKRPILKSNRGGLSKVIGYSYKDISFNNFTGDIIIKNILIKNETLNELITPVTTSNDIIITNVSSSNSSITASLEDNNIRLTGNIEYGDTQTTTLIITYRINGYDRTIEQNIGIEYPIKITPFIITNNTGAYHTMTYFMGAGSSDFEVATMSNHVFGTEDYEDISFNSVKLTTSAITVGLDPGVSFLIRSSTHIPSSTNYLKFAFNFKPSFDGDILGTCGGKMVPYACFEMFSGSTTIVDAPLLPYTELADYCYAGMFDSCTALTTAPELPANKLTEYCYSEMFYDCSKLSYIKMLATDISAKSCLEDWLANVSSSGTIVKHPNMNSLVVDSDSGIPSGWTVEDIIE